MHNLTGPGMPPPGAVICRKPKPKRGTVERVSGSIALATCSGCGGRIRAGIGFTHPGPRLWWHLPARDES